MTLFVSGCSRDPLEDGEDGGGDELADLCRMGCADIRACAPSEYDGLFADDADCQASCFDRFDACRTEAYVYLDCVAELACDDVVVLLTEGPAATLCGQAFDATLTACQ